VIFESFLDYFIKNMWHRIFDGVILMILYWAIISPIKSMIKDFQSTAAAAATAVAKDAVPPSAQTDKK
jgi:hypothetical protein